jgi:hypothetical protein
MDGRRSDRLNRVPIHNFQDVAFPLFCKGFEGVRPNRPNLSYIKIEKRERHIAVPLITIITAAHVLHAGYGIGGFRPIRTNGICAPFQWLAAS